MSCLLRCHLKLHKPPKSPEHDTFRHSRPPYVPREQQPRSAKLLSQQAYPPLHFGINSLPHPSHVSAMATSDIFGDLVTAVEATKAEPPSDDLRSSVQGVQSGALSPPPSPPPVKPEFQSTPSVPLDASSPHVCSPLYTHRSTAPIYPLMPGQSRPDPPPPNIAIVPKKYYVLTKGLHLGVYYDKW